MGTQPICYLRLRIVLRLSPAVWQEFIEKVFENISTRERHRDIMDNTMIFSTHKEHLEDIANLFMVLTKF